MPRLDDIIEKRKKKNFVKKSYRPWDLSGEGEAHHQETQISNESNQPKASINNLPNSSEQTATNKDLENTNPIDNILDNKLDTYIDNNQATIGKQFDINSISIRKQSGNEQITDKIANRQQLDNSLNPASLQNRVAKLSGIQRRILDFVVDICSARETLETGPIETKILSQHIKTTYGSTKISINRLIEKRFLTRKEGRTARGGYINLGLPDEVKNVVISLREKHQRHLNPIELVNFIRDKLDNNIDNNDVYNSSNYNNITTTKRNVIPKEWENVNYEVLSEIGFSKTQLKQLVDKTDPEIVQESIHHFAYGLQHNAKMKKYENPLNVLMGVLRKGQAWVEPNYQSPQEIAQQQLIEQKKAERDRLKKLEEEAYHLALSEWRDSLSQEELEKIAPNKKDRADIMPQEVKISIFFKENIWPEKKKEYLISD